MAIKRPQLKGLINGVLRQFQRQQEALLAEFAEHENRYLHPKWLLKRLQQARRSSGRRSSRRTTSARRCGCALTATIIPG